MNKLYIRKTLDYITGDIIHRILLIFLLPIFTHFMVPEEYAVYTNMMIFISFASLIYLLGFQQALFSYFYHERTYEYKYTLINSIYIVLSIVGIILSFLIIIFRNELSWLIVRTNLYGSLFIWLGIIIFFDVISGITQSLLNIMEKSSSFSILTVLKHLLLLVLIIIAAITKKFSIQNIFVFITISSVLSALAAIVVINRIQKSFAQQITKKKIFSFKIVKKLLSFGIVMIPGTLAMISLRVTDRYMLTYLSANSLYDVGIYAVGYRIGMIMQFLVSIVSLVYFPYAMRIADQPGAKKSYRNIFNYFVLFGGILGFLIIFFSPEIFQIFINRSYFEAIRVVFFGVISIFLLGVFNIINISFYVKKNAGNIALAVGLGAGLNIILNFILIPKYGIYGAGFASIIAYLFIVVFNYSVARRTYEVGYKFIYVLIALAVMFIFAILNFIIPVNLHISLIKFGVSVMFLCIGGYKLYRIEKFREFAKLFLKKVNENEV